MILRHMRHKSSRPDKSGRERAPQARGTDIILIMMAVLLVLLCAYEILFG